MPAPDWLPSPAQRVGHHEMLAALTQIPTAAGCEERVLAFIRAWANGHATRIRWREDAAGNVEISLRSEHDSGSPSIRDAPIYFAAHLDHPAFVVHRVVSSTVLQLEFRGGVMAPYFENARVVVHVPSSSNDLHASSHAGANRAPGSLFQSCEKAPTDPFDTYLCELASPASWIRPGMIVTWDLPESRIEGGLLYSPACDDLSGVAAALAAADTLLSMREPLSQDVRLLFTRAEEIGFIGALAACRARWMPAGSRILMIENSRAFDDSPIGGGPIVRVGDRLSIFSPALTAAVCKRAEAIGGPSSPPSTQRSDTLRPWPWQRKLMAGGACESTAYQAYGYETTCICLPLGNYHNMANLSSVQSGQAKPGDATIAPEFISIRDFDGLVDLLIACGLELPSSTSTSGPHVLLESLWKKGAHVLGSQAAT